MTKNYDEATKAAGHTPGPWRYWLDEQYPATGRFYIFHKDLPLASVAHGGSYPDQDISEANARLIAAAPELAETLRLAADVLDGNCDCQVCGPCMLAKRARAVLAKLEGDE